eukprot:1195273-Prorocentrum_minimum.AAC.12
MRVALMRKRSSAHKVSGNSSLSYDSRVSTGSTGSTLFSPHAHGKWDNVQCRSLKISNGADTAEQNRF